LLKQGYFFIVLYKKFYREDIGMRIRFGYVAIALAVPQGSPNKTVTVKTLEKIKEPQDRLNRLRRITAENLATTLRVLRYNAAHGIYVYRFTSKTVPLATHPMAKGFQYAEEFGDEFRQIGDYIRSHSMRFSAHPDHFTVLNSPQSEVLAAALVDLDYHARLFEAMGLSIKPSLVLHVGGLYNHKALSLERFVDRYRQLPERLRARIMLENDDKIYTAADVLSLCERLGCSMVLDIHHHRCNNNGEKLAELWPRIVATWNDLTPKIHVSSPKSEKDCRSHADFVAAADVLPFLEIAAVLGRDLDIMVEAKQKDEAMFRLVDELAALNGIRRPERAILEI
jgi:UV DNA damage endonuclease